MSIDPVTTDSNDGGNFNRYAYANNSPYRYIDPDGRDFCGSYQCEKYDSGNRAGGNSVSSGMTSSAKAGAVLGGVAGAVVAGGCDIYTLGACAAANPALVGAGAAGGALAGAAAGAMMSSGSALLAKNIALATSAVKQQFEASHHIVAENDPRAAESRRILGVAGMDINSAFNGMNMSSQYHARLHTTVYHIGVETALTGATSFTDVAARLSMIQLKIRMGVFPF